LYAYLILDVLERGRTDKGETDEEYIGLRVGQWAETIIILLSGSIPKTEVDGLSIDHDIGRVVIEPIMRIITAQYKREKTGLDGMQ
jgi:hypothetical protein